MGGTAPMSFLHLPLRAVIGAFTVAVFRISVISEPQPASAAHDLFPDGFPALTGNPSFPFLVLDAT